MGAPSIKPLLTICYLNSLYNTNNTTKTSPPAVPLYFLGEAATQNPSFYTTNPKLHLQEPKKRPVFKSKSTFFQARCLALQQQEQPNLLLLPLLSEEHRKYSFFLLLLHFQFARCCTMTVTMSTYHDYDFMSREKYFSQTLCQWKSSSKESSRGFLIHIFS